MAASSSTAEVARGSSTRLADICALSHPPSDDMLGVFTAKELQDVSDNEQFFERLMMSAEEGQKAIAFDAGFMVRQAEFWHELRLIADSNADAIAKLVQVGRGPYGMQYVMAEEELRTKHARVHNIVIAGTATLAGQLRTALGDRRFKDRLVSSPEIYRFVVTMYAARIMMAFKQVKDIPKMREALGIASIQEIAPVLLSSEQSAAGSGSSAIASLSNPCHGPGSGDRNIELNALYNRVLDDLALNPAVRLYSIIDTGKIAMWLINNVALELALKEKVLSRLTKTSRQENMKTDEEIATTMKELQTNRVVQLQAQGSATGLGFGATIPLNDEAFTIQTTALVEYGAEYRKEVAARYAAETRGNTTLRNALLGNRNYICVWVEEVNILEEYFLYEVEGDTVGCLLLQNTRPMKFAQINREFGGIAYVSFVNRGGDLKVKNKFVPESVKQQSQHGGLFDYQRDRVALHCAAVTVFLHRLKVVSRMIKHAFKLPKDDDPNCSHISLQHAAEEKVVQQAFMSRGFALKGSEGLFTSENGVNAGEPQLPTVNYATVLAALAMWKESKVGKGIATYQCLNTTRQDGSRLILAQLVTDPELGDLRSRGGKSSRDHKVMVFADENSPVWTKKAMMG